MDDGLIPYKAVEELVMAGRMLEAWDLAQSCGTPLARWPRGPARRVAAMLASGLGARKLSQVLDLLAWREDRNDPAAFFQALFVRLQWVPEAELIPKVKAFLSDHPRMKATRAADFHALLACMHAGLRDFEIAEREIAEAMKLAADESWIHVCAAVVHSAADRYDEALLAGRRALELRPHYRAAVLQCAETLVHLGRDDEAIALLKHADENTSNAAFAIQLQVLFSEREDHATCLQWLKRAEECMPLADVGMRKWLAARRADFLLMGGDIDGFLESEGAADPGFRRQLAAALQVPGARDRKRVRLAVPFVRQHSMTCAPATLAALAAFWNTPHDHLAIADAICHEGTPWHKERKWAEENGFVAREFRLTEQVLHQVIDRGIPFTLTTQAVTSAHLQACIGYDARTGLALVRDPTERHFVEMRVDDLISAHPIGGPRCMLLVPTSESDRLSGVLLPDEAAYDAFHGLLVALDANDGWAIEVALATVRSVDRDGMISAEAEIRVTGWREDWKRQLEAVERLLERTPEHEPLLLMKSGALARLGRGLERRKFLEEQVARANADPIFAAELGELLLEDARQLPRAEQALRRALRLRRREARVHESLARCRMKQLRHQEAAWLKRISANLAPSFEPYARGYFDSCRVRRCSDTGIAFLQARCRRMGAKAGGPWVTLAEALDALDRHKEATEVLQRGLAERPEDGDLLLSAGRLMVSRGGEERMQGRNWMEQARGRVPESRWREEMAGTAEFLGDRVEAIRHWRGLRSAQPQSVAALRGMARCVAADQGERVAREWIEGVTLEFPDWAAAWGLLAEMQQERPVEAVAVLDRLLTLNPTDLWALRERALRKLETKDLAGAEGDAREAVSNDPWSAPSHATLGSVLKARGRTSEAIAAMRDAVRLDIDAGFAAERWFSYVTTDSQREGVLLEIEREMRRQVSHGGIFGTYQELCWQVLAPQIVLGRLQRFCDERPDLFETWSARIEQALRMGMHGEAKFAADQLTRRFPLAAAAWLELARVHRDQRCHEDEEMAAARAVALSPGWDSAARAHAHVLELLGRSAEAIEGLRRAVRLNPREEPNHRALAEALTRSGLEDQALATAQRAAEFCPLNTWVWQLICSDCMKREGVEAVDQALKTAAGNFGHHPDWWLVENEVWSSFGNAERALRAVQLGLERFPEQIGLRDMLAYQQWKAGDLEAALAACAAIGEEDLAPLALRGRRAWLLMHSGQPLTGVAEMRQLVAAEPSYGWGFNQLADWHRAREEWSDLKEICRKWMRAEPGNVVVSGFLGMAELGLGDRSAAKHAFARSCALDPSYIYGVRQLLDLQMQDRELEAAGITLARLERYAGGPHVAVDGIELELERGDTAAALQRLEPLLEDERAGVSLFVWIVDLFHKHDRDEALRSWFLKRFRVARMTAPGALVAAMRLAPSWKSHFARRRWLKREDPGGESRVGGWKYLIEQAGRRPSVYPLVIMVILHRAEFRASRVLWNSALEELIQRRCLRLAWRWAADWRERSDDLSDATFVNLAFLSDRRGTGTAAWHRTGEIFAEGFGRFPDASYTPALRAGHALHLAVDGELDRARELLADFDPSQAAVAHLDFAFGAEAVVAADDGDAELAVTKLRTITHHVSLAKERTKDRLLLRLENVLLAKLPEFRGRRSQLRRRYTPDLDLPRPWMGRGLTISSIATRLGQCKWMMAIFLIIVVRVCSKDGSL